MLTIYCNNIIILTNPRECSDLYQFNFLTFKKLKSHNNNNNIVINTTLTYIKIFIWKSYYIYYMIHGVWCNSSSKGLLCRQTTRRHIASFVLVCAVCRSCAILRKRKIEQVTLSEKWNEINDILAVTSKAIFLQFLFFITY